MSKQFTKRHTFWNPWCKTTCTFYVWISLEMTFDIQHTHMYQTYVSHIRITHTGWRRPIRCLKLQVIFRKRATDYWALLQKMTCNDKASYGVLPPCITHTYDTYVSHTRITHTYHTHVSHIHMYNLRRWFCTRMTHLIVIGHFPQKSPLIKGSFAKMAPATSGILCIFATLYHTYVQGGEDP